MKAALLDMVQPYAAWLAEERQVMPETVGPYGAAATREQALEASAVAAGPGHGHFCRPGSFFDPGRRQ